MRRLLVSLRLLVAIAIAMGVGTLPACGSMGMKYFTDPPAFTAT